MYSVEAFSPALADQIRTSRSDAYGNSDLPAIQVGPRSPCRVCLQDIQPGEEALLLTHSPRDQPHPYRFIGPVFIHVEACRPYAERTGVPPLLQSRQLSLRAFDAQGELLDGRVVHGAEAQAALTEMFADGRVDAVHAHNAGVGCLLCCFVRSER